RHARPRHPADGVDVPPLHPPALAQEGSARDQQEHTTGDSDQRRVAREQQEIRLLHAGAIWCSPQRRATLDRALIRPMAGSVQAAPASRPLLALLIRLGAIAALATMSALIKLAAERDIHLLEIMFWRQFITIPIALGWVLATTGIGALATKRPRTHFLRG